MLTTYDLLNDINRMRGLFDSFFSDRTFMGRAEEYPNVNLYEKDDEIEIAVLAPGQKVNDINIELKDNRLLIEADKKDDHVDNNYIRTERTFGTFRKYIDLPYRVDPEKINASIKDGILTIKLVKSPDAKPKKILIN